MSRELPVRAVVITGVVTLLMVAVFLISNRAFGGPGSRFGESPYTAKVVLPETGQLLDRSLVMINGVPAGSVLEVDGGPERTVVTFKVDEEYAPLREGATVQVGTRTAFGEAFLQLRRSTGVGAEIPSGGTVRALPSVESDEALEVMGPKTRKHLTSAVREVDRGIARGDDPARLRATVGELATTVTQLRRLTRATADQEVELGRLVEDGRTIAGALAQRDAAIRGIVTDGATTLQATARQAQALEATVAEAHATVIAGDRVVRGLPGLMDDAEPALEDARAVARDLRPVFSRIEPTVEHAAAVVDALPQFAAAAAPVLRDAGPVVRVMRSVSVWLVPSLRNLIPLAEWMRPRARDYASAFANGAAAASSGDSESKWIRATIFLDHEESYGRKGRCEPGATGHGVSCSNPYPAPGDALNPQPARAGQFPRLLPAPAP